MEAHNKDGNPSSNSDVSEEGVAYWIYIVAVVGFLVIIICLCVLCCCCKKKDPDEASVQKIGPEDNISINSGPDYYDKYVQKKNSNTSNNLPTAV